MMRRALSLALVVPAIGVIVWLTEPRVAAHKGIVSPYTYNADIYPIVERRCRACHSDGTVGPMSLMTYKDAMPWGQALHAELLAAAAGQSSSPDAFVSQAHTRLDAREMDRLLMWGTGGTPEGEGPAPMPTPFKPAWLGGPPDVVLTMAQPHTMAADVMHEMREFTLTTGLPAARTLRGIDLLPGTPAIVRTATISVAGSGESATQTVDWTPGREALATLDPPLALPAGEATVRLTIRYRKTWRFEGETASDTSAVGLYWGE